MRTLAKVGSTIAGVTVFQIDDPGDPRIADYRNVPDPALLERQQAFVAEGRLVVRRLLASPRLVTKSVMVTEPALAALGVDVTAIPVYVVPQAVMNTVTGFNLHRGCLAIGQRGTPLDWRTLAGTARRLVVLERVANTDNVGAIFRNAAAFGVDAVLLGPDCADPLYRKAIRTSMGAALSVPFAHLGAWPDGLRQLRADGFHVMALTPCAGAPPLSGLLREARPTGDRVAIVAGHEGDGLTPEAMHACDTLARIPMTAGHDSLNVATAVAIALYELSQS
jgi:tRNA G18 (ribose-2'-O)-methylase SpoU